MKGNVARKIGPMTTVTSYTLLCNSTTTLAACDVFSKPTQPTEETLRWINSIVTGQEKNGNMRSPPRGKREREDYRVPPITVLTTC